MILGDENLQLSHLTMFKLLLFADLKKQIGFLVFELLIYKKIVQLISWDAYDSIDNPDYLKLLLHKTPH